MHTWLQILFRKTGDRRLACLAPALLLAPLGFGGCTAINGMQNRVTYNDVDPSNPNRVRTACPSEADLANFKNATTSDEKRRIRDDTITLCVKLINNNYDTFKENLQAESVVSNLTTDVLALGLTGGAALTTGKTATQFSQGALAVLGIGADINKDVFYQQALPAIESSMDAKRSTILKGIVDAEKADPTASNYTLDNASFDLGAYESAGNLYAAISELTTTANTTAAAAQKALTISEGLPYDIVPLPPPVQAAWKAMRDKIVRLTDQTKLNAVALRVGFTPPAGSDPQDVQLGIIRMIDSRLRTSPDPTGELSKINASISGFLPA